MSGGIAAVFHFDGRPVEAKWLEGMSAGVAHRGPDGETGWDGAGAAIRYHAFLTVPEESAEKGPVADGAGRVVLAMDGRIDNREEMLALTGCGAGATDAELLLAGYGKAGEGIFAKVLGDFAVVVWHTESRELLLVRDRAAVRPLYYAEIGGGVAVASELRGLLAYPEVKSGWNDAMFAAVLAEVYEPFEETLYAGIRRVRNNQLVRISGGGRRSHFYWRPRLEELRYEREEEYAEHFREVMGTALRALTRARGAVGSYLSGGMDSSTVTALAHGVAPGRIQPYSTVHPGTTSDESYYIGLIERHLGLRSRQVRYTVPEPEFADTRIDFYRDSTACPNFSPLTVGTARAAAGDGVRVVLGGLAGNACMEAYDVAAGESLLRGRLGELRADYRQSGRSFPDWLGDLLLVRLRPVAPVPGWARRGYRRLSGRPHSKYPGLTEAASREVDERREQAIGEMFRGWEFVSVDQFWRARLLLTRGHCYANEQIDRDLRHLGMEERHVFFDARVMEFSLRTPGWMLRRGQVQKYLMRKAMEGRLPREVLRRLVQASPGVPCSRATPPSAGEPDRTLGFCIDEGLAEELRGGYHPARYDDDFGRAYRHWSALGLARVRERNGGLQ